MPTFEFQTKDGRRFQFDAPNQEAATKAFDSVQRQKSQPWPGGAAGAVAHGVAQNIAGTADMGLSALDAIGGIPGAKFVPGMGQASALAGIIPKDWRKGLSEFADAPIDPEHPIAQRVGYYAPFAAESLYGVARGTMAGAKGAMTLWESASPEMKELLKTTASSAGTEAAIDLLFHSSIPGVGALLGAVGRTTLKKLITGAVKGGAEEAAEHPPPVPKSEITPRGRIGSVEEKNAAAFKNEQGVRGSPEWGPEQEAELNRRFPKIGDVPPTAKPRIRVPAQSRPSITVPRKATPDDIPD